MAFSSFVKNQSTKIYDRFANKPGDLLLWTGTFGWLLSSLAHVTAVIVNDKIPKDQKKFLIPQELADAAVNIASFFVITNACTRLGEKLVKSGKLTTPKIIKFLEEKGIKDKIGTKGFDISSTDYINELKPNFNKDFKGDYYNFFDGVSFVASTTGSIISSNIITPILRNKFAADRQKKSIAEEKLQNESILPTKPVLPAQNRFGIDDYKNKTSNAPLFMPSGSMRV